MMTVIIFIFICHTEGCGVAHSHLGMPWQVSERQPDCVGWALLRITAFFIMLLAKIIIEVQVQVLEVLAK